MAANNNSIRNMLLVCGLSDQQNAAGGRPTQLFIDSAGLTDVTDIGVLLSSEVGNMIKNHNMMPGQTARLGAVHQRKIQALIYWCSDHKRRGAPIVPAEWNQAALTQAIDDMDVADSYKSGDHSKVQPPGPVETGHKWVAWEILFENYIASLRGASQIPLDYVIRRTMPAAWTATSAHDILKYQAIQTGTAWNADNITVFRVLKSCCMNTPAWEWISQHDSTQSGQAATASLRLHYEGAGESNKRVTWAQAELEGAHYKSEFTWAFEKFATSLQRSYAILAINGEVHNDREKVRVMLKKMEVPNNPGVEAVKRICSNAHGDNFLDAVTYLSSEITNLFPEAQLEAKSGKRRRISEVRGGGRGGGGGRGRGRGRGGRGFGRGRGGRGSPSGRGGRFGGVDVSDIHRSFTAGEWEAAGYDGRAHIMRARSGGGRGGPGRGRGHDGRGGRTPERTIQEVGVDPVTITEESADDAAGRGGRGARNGSRFGRGAYSGP